MSAKSYAYDVFISFSSEDRGWVADFYARLSAAGLKIWYDGTAIRWGEPIRAAIKRGIRQSRHLILVLSPGSVGEAGREGSAWVELEHLIATHFDPANRDRKLLPLLLRDCVIPDDIEPFRYLDAREPGALDMLFPEILAALRPEAERRGTTMKAMEQPGRSAAEPAATTPAAEPAATTPAAEPAATTPAAEAAPQAREAASNTFTWLHLSDLHMKADTDWRRDVVLRALKRDVIAKLAGEGLQPDLVFVSGDLAHGGKTAEYEKLQAFFADINQTLALDPARHWFTVPGNHDVDRGAIEDLDLGLREILDAKRAPDLLSSAKTWQRFAARQQGYFGFTHRFHGQDRAWRAERPWWVGGFRKAGLRVALLCLNSAWCAQDDGDKGKLLLGEYQIRQALDLADELKPHLKIALFHHPFDHLADFDGETARALLQGPDGCHLLLRGHLHQTKMAMEITPDGHSLSLAAGACWQDATHPHAVLAGQLDLATGTIAIHVWRYTKDGGGFWARDNHLARNMPDGIWRLDAPKSWLLPAVESTPPAPAAAEPPSADQPPAGPAIPGLYRQHLQNRYTYLETAFVLDKAANFKLESCYVPLLCDWLEPEKRRLRGKKHEAGDAAMLPHEEKEQRRPLAELVQLPEHRHFVVRAEPGGGKTTFVRYTALSCLEPSSTTLPILLSLKDFGFWLCGKSDRDGEALPRWAGSVYAGNGLDESELLRRSGHGRLLWLLDGLDEIFDTGLRLRAAQIIGHWFGGRGQTDRLLLTSRPHALDQPNLLAALGLHERVARVLPLDEPAQQAFLKHWFAALYRETPQQGGDLRALLWQALERQPYLAELRGIPLMLGTVASVYHQGKRLPERRADLYGRAVLLLLSRRFGPEAPGGSEEKVRRLRRGLETAAFEMFLEGQVRDLGEPDFLAALSKGFHPEGGMTSDDRDSLATIARELGCHSGLLGMQGEPPRYSFPHLGFQEYLAAGVLCEAEDPVELLGFHLDEGTWREVVLLTAGRLFESGITKLGKAFLEALAERCGDPPGPARLALTMDAVVEAPPGTPLGDLPQKLAERAVNVLATRENKHPEQVRADLGRALGRLGDPRLGMANAARWQWLEPGSFTMGDDASDRTIDKPQHRVTLTRGFYLGRYPVTNEEYRAFVSAGGYENEQWWDPEGWTWLTMDEAAFETWFAGLIKEHENLKGLERFFRPGKQPLLWQNEAYNGANQPVVGVNWFEARAFCNWLTAELSANPPAGWNVSFCITLPSEAQWEYAARGEKGESDQISAGRTSAGRTSAGRTSAGRTSAGRTSAGRTYPWGAALPSEARANFDKRLKRTTAVGCYSDGATPEGLLDMGGNVWEWCSDLWQDKAYAGRGEGVNDPVVTDGDPDLRSLRGGSWNDVAGGLAAALRDGDWARLRSLYVGFRCCVSPAPAVLDA